MSGRLFKLKFYCSLCQKQLKDDNGYKCHLQSASHKQMMGSYMTNPEQIVSTFSKEFESGFLDILKTRHPKTAVLANTVYQELIKDQDHIHMNMTRWSNLSEFVKYLEVSSICTVDWNEGRPIIKHIDGKEVVRETEEEKRIRKRELEVKREEREFRRLGVRYL
jgi:DNA/RNA-binding protein KIN17